MSLIFSIALLSLVLLSFAMAIGVPLAYASGTDWDRSRPLLWIGSIAWVGLVFAVGFLNFLV